MVYKHRLLELVNALYDEGELMVRARRADDDDDCFVLDKSGTTPQQCNTRGRFDDDDRLLANGVFALCGIDPAADEGRVVWDVVRRVYEDELKLIETTYDLYEYAGADGVSDALYDLVVAGDPRLAALPELGPKDR